jgi:hypothetical protein
VGLSAACTPPPAAVEVTPWPGDRPEPGPSIVEPGVAHAFAAPVAARRLWLPRLHGGAGDAPVPAAPSPPPPTAEPTAAPTAVPPVGAAGELGCAGIAVRDGDRLVVDGVPVFFFGVNVHYLLDPEFPEERVDPLVAALAELGVNTLRVWYFYNQDPDRFERLLDVGRRHGVRFVVTLEDNVFKGIDWFFSSKDEDTYRPHLDRTVARFKDRPEILFWEVINEPNCGDGRFDDDCQKRLRDWLAMASRRIKEVDACHVVSTGMIGAGNMANEQQNYRLIHRKDSIDIVSVHKRSTDAREAEVEFAAAEERPIFYGEIYDQAYDEDCRPLDDGRALEERAERIKGDLRQAIDDGVDGYLLWDYAEGTITTTSGESRHYCSTFGYGRDDPVWSKLRRAGLPPAVPWR